MITKFNIAGKIASFSLLGLAIGLFPQNLSAQFFKNRKKKSEIVSGGQLHIGQPVFFSRERLINEMLEEREFLDNQLEKTITIQTEGFIDSRDYNNLSLGLGLGINKNLGKVNDAQATYQEERLQRQNELEAARHQSNLQAVNQQSMVNSLFLKNLVSALKDDSAEAALIKKLIETTPTTPPTVPNYDNGTVATPIDPTKTGADETYALDVPGISYESTKDPRTMHLSSGETLIHAAPAPSPTKTLATVSSIGKISDQLEWRNFVRSKRRQIILDDTHDRNGKNLFHMTFPITFVPPKEADAFLELRCKIEPHSESDRKVSKKIENVWIETLRREIIDEFGSLRKRVEDHGSGAESQLFYFVDRWSVEKDVSEFQWATIKKEPNNNLGKTPGAAKIFESFETLRSFQELDSTQNNRLSSVENFPKTSPDTEKKTFEFKAKTGVPSPSAIAVAKIAEKYEDLVKFSFVGDDEEKNPLLEATFSSDSAKKYFWKAEVSFNESNSLGIDGTLDEERTILEYSIRFIHLEEKSRECLENLVRKLPDAPRSDSVQALSVEPSFQVQNISQVASKQIFTNLALAVSAQMPGGVGASGELDSIKNNEEIFSTLQRKPIVFGFIEGVSHTEIGSPFGWYLGPKFEIQRKQTGVFRKKNSSSVNYSHSPTVVSVNATFLAPSWVENYDLKYQWQWIDKDTGKPVGKIQSDDIHFQLPVSLTPLIDLVMSSSGTGEKGPVIYAPQKHYEMIVETGGQSLVIPGRNLWRVPEVYIDGYEASKVKVIGNMQGIIATWDLGVPTVPGHRRDLRVVTPAGHDVLTDAIQFVPRPSKPSGSYDMDINARFDPQSTPTQKKVTPLVAAPLKSSDRYQLANKAISVIQIGYRMNKKPANWDKLDIVPTIIAHSMENLPKLEVVESSDSAIDFEVKITGAYPMSGKGELEFTLDARPKGEETGEVIKIESSVSSESHKVFLFAVTSDTDVLASLSDPKSQELDFTGDAKDKTLLIRVKLPASPLDEYVGNRTPGYNRVTTSDRRVYFKFTPETPGTFASKVTDAVIRDGIIQKDVSLSFFELTNEQRGKDGILNFRFEIFKSQKDALEKNGNKLIEIDPAGLWKLKWSKRE